MTGSTAERRHGIRQALRVGEREKSGRIAAGELVSLSPTGERVGVRGSQLPAALPQRPCDPADILAQEFRR